MTRAELVDALLRARSLPRPLAEAVVDHVLGGIGSALTEGKRVEIRGFGSFQLRSYEGYTGRHPKTNTPIQIAPKILPAFRVGKELKERLARPRPPSDTPPTTSGPTG